MIIWVLADDRVGSNNQSIAVAEKLSTYYVIKKIVYNNLIFLPNFIRRDSLLGVNLINSSDIVNELPDVIVCAGRRLSSIALNIKKRNKNKTFIINIMNPDYNIDKFDLVLLPQHDNLPSRIANKSNIIRTIGSLSIANPTKIINETNKWKDFFKEYSRPLVSMVIGGDTKDYKYNSKEFGETISKLSKIVNDISGTLLISSSRRTSESCIEEIRKNINCDYYFYDWKWENDDKNIRKNPLGNPYFALLGSSDFIIVTGDSISMISECCTTKKPIYIYIPKKPFGEKHQKFCNYIIKNGYAKKFDKTVNELEKFSYEPLNELDRIINIINKKLKVK